jgi:hypothetical protein
VDALYDGPSGGLSAVDKRQDQRVRYAVLDHDPIHDDIAAFLGRLKTALEDRHCTLPGLTTAGSPRYPAPIRTVFGAVPHPLGTFHVIIALATGVVKAGAKERGR